ncbi:MAG TPA: TIGR03032 family protein [Solirubrobacterales bacterium]|nr:TIGR03032 family protein [Solirubrobacterales bacterium]
MSEGDDHSEDEAGNDRPPTAVFVVGAPGAGGPALAGALATLPAFTAHDVEPPEGDRQDDRLTAELAREPFDPAEGTTLVGGAPRLSLQLPYLRARYPGCRFVYCWRPPQEALFHAWRGWSSEKLVTHPDLEGWDGPPWSFALTPGWKELAGKELGEIVAAQWLGVTRTSVEDLAGLEPSSWAVTSHAALRGDPSAELGRLCGFLDVDPAGLRQAAEVLRNQLEAEPPIEELPAEISAVLPSTLPVARQAEGWLAAPRPARGAGSDPASRQSPLRSVHTGSMPNLLGQLGSSLLVSTYQAGKLIIGRKDGIRLNTHFRSFDQPMGLATHEDRLAIGTRSTVLEYRNMPAAAEKLEPAGSHDACYVFRKAHVTGDVRIHDVGYANGELWFVATAFSCLATLDDDHSFVPRWSPPFISKVAPGDRCHLNGMEIVDDEVGWATALGQTDEPGGWRENKASGGCLIHVPSNEIALEGLSMPHSPRVHDGRLWILESGQGRLCSVDPEAGTRETVCELPGFTRGLTFAGPLAFVGLSQIRETATFGGLPLTERLDDRLCGVWAVNIESGEIVGFLRFEEAVQEVYDVAVLPGIKMPEVAEVASETTLHSYVIKGWRD